jgi:hypothetical protein
VDTVLCPQGRGGGGVEGRAGEGREQREVSSSVRTHGRVCVDASVLPPRNFITDATVRLSHRRPSGHRPFVRVTTLLLGDYHQQAREN